MRYMLWLSAVLSAVLSLATTVAAQQAQGAAVLPAGNVAQGPSDTGQPSDATGASASSTASAAYAPARVEPEPPVAVEPAFTRNITINPLAMIFTVFNVEVESRIASMVSFFVGPQVLLSGNVIAFGMTTGVRFFMVGEANEGFWISPELGWFYATGGGASAMAYSAGALLGYTAIWSHFVLSFGGGVRYVDLGTSAGSSASGVGPALRLSVGYAF